MQNWFWNAFFLGFSLRSVYQDLLEFNFTTSQWKEVITAGERPVSIYTWQLKCGLNWAFNVFPEIYNEIPAVVLCPCLGSPTLIKRKDCKCYASEN